MAASTIATLGLHPYGWSVCASNADWSGCEIAVAKSATATESLYLTQLAISSSADLTVNIGAGETGGAVTASGMIAGPVKVNVDIPVVIPFDKPIKLPANTDLVVDASGAGTVTVIAQGFTR